LLDVVIMAWPEAIYKPPCASLAGGTATLGGSTPVLLTL
jgi:hypothetical protein